MTVELNLPDPDPTPTATPWQEYLAAAQSLDAVVREAAAEAAATTRSVREELARLQAELDRQRAQLLASAAAAGLPAPPLLPGPAEQAAAEQRVSPDPATIAEALRHSERLIAVADAHLGVAPPATGPLPPVPPAPAGMPATGPVPMPPAPGPPVPPAPPLAPPVTSAPPVPPAPARTWWPPPVWLLVAVPLGSATLLLCVVSLIVAVAG